MILAVNLCKEKLHYYEFVKPIENVLKSMNLNFKTKHYKDILKNDLEKSSKIIICGTSLFDNQFIEDVDYFKWIFDFKKPILGICGGMQIIGLIFGGKLLNKTEIGFYNEKFKKEFLGLAGKQEVYHLHNNYVNFNELKEFDNYSFNKIIQAVKHKEKEIYGALFHPEVRQKGLIVNFCNLTHERSGISQKKT